MRRERWRVGRVGRRERGDGGRVAGREIGVVEGGVFVVGDLALGFDFDFVDGGVGFDVFEEEGGRDRVAIGM